MKAELPRFPAGADSLIKKYLTPEVYADLAGKQTATGFTIDAAIRSGLENADSSIGIYLGDRETYTRFESVLSPIIRDYHKIDADPFQTRIHRDEFAPVSLPKADPEGMFIRSSRIRVARNLNQLPFCPHMSAADRIELEKRTGDALGKLPPDLSGNYISFTDLSPDEYDAMRTQKLAFPRGDRFQESAGLNQDFPTARGVFLSRDQGFRVWVNEEDHLRVMALSANADLSGVFNRLLKGLNYLNVSLDFAFDPSLGFLSSCPTNIGTAMRAGVHIRLPKLDLHRDILKEAVTRHHLQIRGTGGEKTAVEKAVFDISNARRLGVSANQIICDLHDGLTEIIATEKKL